MSNNEIFSKMQILPKNRVSCQNSICSVQFGTGEQYGVLGNIFILASKLAVVLSIPRNPKIITGLFVE